MEVYSLKGYQISELEKLLEVSPWFSIARKELFLKMSAMGEEYRREALRRTVLYLYPDYSVFREGYVLSCASAAGEPEPVQEQVYELDFSEAQDRTGRESDAAVDSEDGFYVSEDAGENGGAVPEQVDGQHRQIYVVGGDYFMPEELKNVQNKDISSLGTAHAASDAEDSSEFTDEAYYTETLARIYAEQELYDRANEVYEKLILLYPEKSAYFAALKNDIKKHL